MSELITRRTFLKATGAAALAVAASGMLAGCGDGAYASTPENLVAPPIDNSDFANFGSFTADIGPLSGQWTSSSIYESDTRHNYFYTGFKLDNGSGTSAVTVNISNFAFNHAAGGTGSAGRAASGQHPQSQNACKEHQFLVVRHIDTFFPLQSCKALIIP